MAISQTELEFFFSFIAIIIFIFEIYFATLFRSRMLFLIGEYKISEMKT